MAEADIDVSLDGLTVLAESAAGDVTALVLTVDRADGRQLVDRLCKALGYWPTRPGPVINVNVNPPCPPPVFIPVPVEPRHRWRA
ncbi:MAG TPA: hypothetical protein VFF24_09730 [Acidimicrobiia bacterium]|nr:hypothetical protein [Acidimicrobiia bacterium]